MPLPAETAEEIVGIVRKHVDQATLNKIIDDLLELRGDKDFRDTVNLFVRLARGEDRS